MVISAKSLHIVSHLSNKSLSDHLILFAAAFFNPIHSAIDNIMLRCDDVFREILNGVLPSAAMVRLAEIDPKALGSLQDLDCSAQTGNVKLIDELFSKQRSVCAQSPTQITNI